MSLLSRIRAIREPGQVGDWKVVLRGDKASIEGRICVVRKSENAIQQAQRRLHRKASKKQYVLKPETLEYAKYVIIFTTLDVERQSKSWNAIGCGGRLSSFLSV